VRFCSCRSLTAPPAAPHKIRLPKNKKNVGHHRTPLEKRESGPPRIGTARFPSWHRGVLRTHLLHPLGNTPKLSQSSRKDLEEVERPDYTESHPLPSGTSCRGSNPHHPNPANGGRPSPAPKGQANRIIRTTTGIREGGDLPPHPEDMSKG
jgi:hypothetical protein